MAMGLFGESRLSGLGKIAQRIGAVVLCAGRFPALPPSLPGRTGSRMEIDTRPQHVAGDNS